MKPVLFFIAVYLSITFISCIKEEFQVPPAKTDILIATEKSYYMNIQEIAYELYNNSDSEYLFFGCTFGHIPVLEIEQYADNEWNPVHFTLCLDYSWLSLPPGSKIYDTIFSNWFDTGKYRLKCQMMLDSVEIPVYSKVFEIVNGKKVEFFTDKSDYASGEKIALTFINHTCEGLVVNWCRLFYKEKFENGEWKSTGGPPCPFDGTFFYIPPNHTISDTLNSVWLDAGKYRLVTFNIRMDTLTMKVHSNEFILMNNW